MFNEETEALQRQNPKFKFLFTFVSCVADDVIKFADT